MLVEWFRINLFYGLSLFFVYFTYAYLLKEIIWKREWPHIIYYFFAFALLGISFNYFLEPNYIKALYKLFLNRLSFEELSRLIISSFFWMGWAILFSQAEKFAIEKLKRKESPKPPQDYLFQFLFYMIFLNFLTIIINYTFRRPI